MFQKIIKRAKELGFTDVEIVEVKNVNLELSLFKGKIDKNFIGSSVDYTLKGLIGNKMAITYFQKNGADLTEQEIDEILLKLKSNVNALTTVEEYSIFEGSKEYPVIEESFGDFSSVPLEEKIEALKKIEKGIYDFDPKMELVDECAYFEEENSLKIINSKGLNLSKSNRMGGFIMGAVASKSKEDPDKQSSYEFQIKTSYKDLDPQKTVNKLCSETIALLGAKPVQSKVYPIIIENTTMGNLLSGFFSMFTGEAAIKKLTSLTDKIEQKIMSEKITIVDDPLNEKALVKNPFDAEGVATYTKTVVDKGVFKLFLHNLKTAKFFKTTSTGNASTSGVTAMNFHIKNGDTSKEEMIKSIEEGLFITSFSGLHAGLNPISGEFSAQAKGFLIENGKISKPVTLIVVSGNFLNMLSDVVSVGNDLELSFRNFSSPTIQFKGLPVSGI